MSSAGCRARNSDARLHDATVPGACKPIPHGFGFVMVSGLRLLAASTTAIVLSLTIGGCSSGNKPAGLGPPAGASGLVSASGVSREEATSAGPVEDMTVRSEVETVGVMSGPKPQSITTYLTATAVRASAPGGDVISRFAERKLIGLDNSERTYWVMNFEDMEEFAASSASGEMAYQMARKALGRLAFLVPKPKQPPRSGKDSAPVFAEDGPGETIAGFATRRYSLKVPPVTAMAPGTQMEIWAAPDLPVPTAFYDNLAFCCGTGDLAKVREQLRKIRGLPLRTKITYTLDSAQRQETSPLRPPVVIPVPFTSAPAVLGAGVGNAAAGLVVDGLNLLLRNMAKSGDGGRIEQVSSVEKGSLAASLFEIPAGYREVPSPLSALFKP